MSKQAKLAADTVPAHEPLKSVGLPLDDLTADLTPKGLAVEKLAAPLSFWLRNQDQERALPRTLAELLADERFCRKLWGPASGTMGRRTILSIDAEALALVTGVSVDG